MVELPFVPQIIYYLDTVYKNTNIANTKREGDDKGDRSVCILIS